MTPQGPEIPWAQVGRPQRPPAKAGVPVWVWLLRGGLVLVMLFGGVGVFLWVRAGSVNPNVTEANYKKIHAGMTQAEVKAILGEPNATWEAYREARQNDDDPREYSGSLMRWKNGADYIEVTFGRDGKATDVGYNYDEGDK